MSKKALRAAAIVVSLCFILGVVPVLNGAENKPVKVNILSILKKPVLFLYSLLNIYPPVIEETPEDIAKAIVGSTSSQCIIKTTGDDTSTPPAKKD